MAHVVNVVPLLCNLEDFPGPDVLLRSFIFLDHRTRTKSLRTLLDFKYRPKEHSD